MVKQSSSSSKNASTPTKQTNKKGILRKSSTKGTAISKKPKPKLGLKTGAKPGEPGIQFPYRLGKSKFGTGIFVQ